MSLVKYNESMPSLNGWMDDFFNTGLLSGFSGGRTISSPAVNVLETNDSYLLEVAAPGLNKKDFKVSVDNGLLVISAKRELQHEENNEQYTRREFSFSSFARTFTLPEGVKQEEVSANYQNGILHVTLPKTEEAKGKAPRAIKIS